MNNPLVATLTKQADELRGSVIETIGNARESLDISLNEVKEKERQIYEKMNSFPVAERRYVELKRQQEISQGVYLILLQKREEVALTLGQARDKAKVLDAAYVKSKPVGPRKLYAAIGMIVLTLVVPVGYLFVKKQTKALQLEYNRQKRM